MDNLTTIVVLFISFCLLLFAGKRRVELRFSAPSEALDVDKSVLGKRGECSANGFILSAGHRLQPLVR